MKVYHNPSCSKSNSTCNLLNDADAEFEIVDYQKTPLDKEEIKDLLTKLNLPANDLIRKGEAIFKEHYGDKELNEVESIEAMLRFPILIQRPIIVKGNRAIIGRPIERVTEFLLVSD